MAIRKSTLHEPLSVFGRFVVPKTQSEAIKQSAISTLHAVPIRMTTKMSDTSISYRQQGDNLQEWWNQARQSKDPPSVPAMFSKIMGQDCNSPAVFNLCKQTLDAAAKKQQFGRVAFLLKDFCAVYEVQKFHEFLQKQVFSIFSRNHIPEEYLWVMFDALHLAANGQSPFPSGLFDFKTIDDLVALQERYSESIRKVILHHSKLTLPQRLLNGDFTDGITLLKSVLPHVRSCDIPKNTVWKDDILLGFLQILSDCPNLKKLIVGVGKIVTKHQGQTVPVNESHLVEAIASPQFLDQPSKCGVQTLVIEGPAVVAEANSDLVFLEYTIKHMLEINYIDISRLTTPTRFVPKLTELLRHSSTLRNLYLQDCFLFHSKQKNTKPPGKDWLPLFCDGLKHNSSQMSFGFTRCTSREDLNICAEAMLDGVKHNPTLLSVTLGDACDNMKNKFSYFTDLNAFGRAKARDPSTPLSAWTDLLVKVLRKREQDINSLTRPDADLIPLYERQAVNRIFGLIQESPSIPKYFSAALGDASPCN